jgi:hypothetical protein
MPLDLSGLRMWKKFRGAADKTKPAPDMSGAGFFW